jgi:hypothetical protein
MTFYDLWDNSKYKKKHGDLEEIFKALKELADDSLFPRFITNQLQLIFNDMNTAEIFNELLNYASDWQGQSGFVVSYHPNTYEIAGDLPDECQFIIDGEGFLKGNG